MEICNNVSKIFCCYPKSEQLQIDEEGVLKEISKMQDFATSHWKERDAFEKYSNMYHSLPKIIRHELKETAIENYLKARKENDNNWTKLGTNEWKRENHKMLSKIAKGRILDISINSSDVILEKFIHSVNFASIKLKEEITFKQKLISCVGLIFTPFQKIAQLISSIFQRIFSLCFKKAHEEAMTDDEVVQVVQEMIVILDDDIALDSMKRIEGLYQSLPLDVQKKLKDNLIEDFVNDLCGRKKYQIGSTSEEVKNWKNQNYKTLEQIAAKIILDMGYNADFCKVLKAYIKASGSED